MVTQSRITRRQFAAGSATAAAALAAPTLIPSATAQDAVVLRYTLWDTNQLPAYQACADRFTEMNPNITVEIEQLGWDDYWTTLQTSLISGAAADVFTNHLARYPELASRGQLVDIQPFVEQDAVDVDQYEGDLAELWTREGARYGLPKDWDTVSVVYNREMLDAAGIDPGVFDEWTWNPDDGGDFGQIIGQLTLDENGNNGLSDDFDPDAVVQYGLAMGLGDAYGQTSWSLFAASTGWTFLEAPWTPPFHFGDERFINTIQWHADQQLETRFAVPEEQISSLNVETVFTSGTCALMFHGSWMINWIADNTTFEFGFGRLPVGPEGRKSMFNGLADSIWSGSPYQEEAWEWVKFLGSEEAQQIVGSYGVVFPAIPSGAEAALDAWSEKGLDVAPYLEQAQEEDGTFLFPIVDNASEYVAIMQPAMQSIALGQARAEEVLPEANDEVNDL
jgi:multiple sugar transport system substrate-binding protein